MSPAMTVAETPSTGPRADSLAGSLLVVLLMAVVQRALGLVREMLFCRWLDQDELGQWSMAFTTLMAGAAICSCGVQGSLSRYVEYYRQRGQLRGYLRRVAITSGCLALATGLTIIAFPEPVSQFVFASPEHITLTRLLGVTLVIVMANNFLIDFYAGLRLFRVVSWLHFLNGVGFVAASLGCLVVRGADSTSLVVGFAAAYAAVFGGLCVQARRLWKSLPADRQPLAGGEFWTRLVRTSAGLWIVNCLFNVFDAVDRVMILHGSGWDEAAAQAALGNYHSARVLPLLLATGTALVASTLMPHLSHDWEAGRRREVGANLRLALKLIGCGLLTAGVAVLALAPWLFREALAGKYAAGLNVLPWVLAVNIWSGLSMLTVNYLWCAERIRLAAAAVTAGIVVNIALNFVWLPNYGLTGAVWATAAANLVQLVGVLLACRLLGMELDRGAWIVALAPASLGLGLEIGFATWLVLLLATAFGGGIFSPAERQRFGDVLLTIRLRAEALRDSRRAPSTTT